MTPDVLPTPIRPLRIAVWGVGAHALRTVLPAIARCPSVHLTGISTRNRPVLDEVAETYGCRAWSEPRAMLASDEVEVVYLATPSALHFDQAEASLRAAKHVWCEKPLTMTYEQAALLGRQAKAAERMLAVVCAPRYHPQFKAVEQQIRTGALGDIRRLRACFQFPHLDPGNYRYDPALGGGALLDIGFYLLSLADALMPGRLVDLNCRLRTEAGYRVDTSAQATLGFDQGAVAELTWGYGFDYANSLSIEGSAGALDAEPFFSKPANRPPRLTRTDLQGGIQSVPFENVNPFIEMLNVFAGAAGSKDGWDEQLAFALRSQELLDRARRTANRTDD